MEEEKDQKTAEKDAAAVDVKTEAAMAAVEHGDSAKKRGRAKAAACIVAACIAGIAVGAAIATGCNHTGDVQQPIAQETTAPAAQEQQDAIAGEEDAAEQEKASGKEKAAEEEDAGKTDKKTVSKTKPVYRTVHHDAVTHTVHHPATYETVTTYETVCNADGTIVTGKTEEHTAKTGHTEFTTNVPLQKKIVKKGAWTETVVDKKAYDEKVVDHYETVESDGK